MRSSILAGSATIWYRWPQLAKNVGLMTNQVISTKLNWGNDYSDMKVNNNGLSRKHIVEAMNGSLKPLQLD